jgi:hypothetical protein
MSVGHTHVADSQLSISPPLFARLRCLAFHASNSSSQGEYVNALCACGEQCTRTLIERCACRHDIINQQEASIGDSPRAGYDKGATHIQPPLGAILGRLRRRVMDARQCPDIEGTVYSACDRYTQQRRLVKSTPS